MGMILIDLQKAFDAIDRKILIDKMNCMGFSNDATKWFECYLSKRMFSVYIENSFSDKSSYNLWSTPRAHFRTTFVFTLRK